ncbi:MAG: AAA-like domain-containing protein [Cyanobacteriota bacterium]|nr:AAA-like domain-containing protein [Cyanobacteriota bacterium]
MDSNLLNIFNKELTSQQQQWYKVFAEYIIHQAKTAPLTVAKLTTKLLRTRSISEDAAKNFAEYLISRGRTAKVSAATLTKELVSNGLIAEGAVQDNNPARRFLDDLEIKELITKYPCLGQAGNIYTLNFYIYVGQALEGVVPLRHPLYIRRTADSICEECLNIGMMKNENRVFLKIKSPRYTGKTSLLIRLREFANKKYAAVGLIDLESHQFSDELFIDGESNEENKEKYKQFLDTFKRVVEQEFNFHIRSSRSSSSSPQWSNISLAEKLTEDLEEKIFTPIQKQKVLLIDGIDRILGTHIQDPFLRMLRTWFEQKMKILENNSSIIFPNISIAFSTESYFDRESPLQNVGTEIQLEAFTEDQILGLAELYGLVWDDGLKSASYLKYFLSGNPYLINMALYEMSKKNIDLKTSQQRALVPNSPFLRHLHKIVEKIKQCEELEKVFTDWLKNQNSYLDPKSAIQLAKLGAIEFEYKDNTVKPKIPCQLYEQYFQQQFLNQNS